MTTSDSAPWLTLFLGVVLGAALRNPRLKPLLLLLLLLLLPPQGLQRAVMPMLIRTMNGV